MNKGPLENAPDGRFSFVLSCGVKQLEKILPQARDFHINTITNALVDARDEVRAIAAQFEDFKKGIETKSTMEKMHQNLHFCGEGDDRPTPLTRIWRTALKT